MALATKSSMVKTTRFMLLPITSHLFVLLYKLTGLRNHYLFSCCAPHKAKRRSRRRPIFPFSISEVVLV